MLFYYTQFLCKPTLILSFVCQYGKIPYRMNPPKMQTLPEPPSLIHALTAGFDTISNHVGVILFCVILDLYLWLGPHLRLAGLFQVVFQQLTASDERSLKAFSEIETAVQKFNLFSSLRTFPIGVPSLMAGRLPTETPLGQTLVWNVESVGAACGLWLLITLVGLIFGCLYFAVVAQVALTGRVSWRSAFHQWPWACLQILFLFVVWMGILGITLAPLSCLMSVFFAGGVDVAQVSMFAMLFIGGFLMWLVMPLVFSPHGIFAFGQAAWVSMRESMRLTRMALFPTLLLILMILVINMGLDVLWNAPADTSWLVLIGILGHAFISTGLLAASFIYYYDASGWMKAMMRQTRPSSIG